MHLQEKTIGSETTYQGKVFYVTKDTAQLEDGKAVQRDVVHHSGGVCVVPLTEKGTVLMVKQFRYPMQQVTLEVPAGKLEKGEDPADCGKRELREEAGRTCGKYTSLGKLFPTPAYDTEVIHMYLAQELSAPEEQELDEGEFLDVTELPLEDAVQMVMNNEIPDAKTQIALLKTWVLLHKGECSQKALSQRSTSENGHKKAAGANTPTTCGPYLRLTQTIQTAAGCVSAAASAWASASIRARCS